MSRFIRSIEWHYDRCWKQMVAVDDDRSLEAKEKLRLWGYLHRWRHFPTLGAPPSSWLRFGEPPDTVALFDVSMQAYMSAPIAASLNEMNSLVSFFSRDQV